MANTLTLHRNGAACRVSSFTLVGFIDWLGVARLLADALKERVAKYAVRLCRSVKIADTGIETIGIDETRRQRGLPDAFDHGCESLSRKTIDKVGSA